MSETLLFCEFFMFREILNYKSETEEKTEQKTYLLN